MMQIPDAAVQAAIGGYRGRATHDSALRSALAAAIPHLPLGYEVKRLIWSKPTLSDTLSRCETVFGTYRTWTHDEAQGKWFWSLEGCIETQGEEADEVAAKSAAQADFERRVRECIFASATNDGTKPVDVEAVRRQALEEAATLIDEGFEKAVGKSWRNDGKSSKNDRCPHDKFMYENCENCASDAIRAMSAATTPEAEE